MRKIGITIATLLLFGEMQLLAQDSILHRVILIGDAGEMDKQQQTLIPDAASRIIPGKTVVVYLGDNVYPRGIGLPGSNEQEKTEQILRSQFQPMRSKGAPVYFIPGNHDWDKMGKQGLAKIKRQWEFLREQNDTLLQLVPPNGCPDPIAIPLGESLVIIAFDSEWWLYPFSKNNPLAGCECNSRDEIIAKFDELVYENRYKTILLASHHPFQSYGTHGGYFTLKDHIFPLTVVNKNLYIPLPVVGSLYPILRKTFNNPEDLKHPLYKDMKRRIDKVLSTSPNLVHVAGHEHGLQYIDNPKTKQVQVVSGGGAKENHTIKGKYSLFGKAGQGYVTADQLIGNTMRFTYYTYTKDGLKQSFHHDIAFQQVKDLELTALAALQGDSIIAQVKPEFDKASRFKRWFFGENYRKEFAAPTKLPIIRISQFHGGLIPEKRGGGMQTVSLRLKDKDGNEWALRNLEKNPDPLLPEELRETFARDLLDDYMSAQHPFAPLVVPSLARAARVPHANPVIGVIAPDPALGVYERLFAGKVALLEEREPLGKSDNTEEMQEEMLQDNDNNFNGQTFLRARLLDLLLSDWDRHADQWRWADTQKGKGKFYEPVPRDRDQALYTRQGIIPSLASRSWVLPTLQGFGGKIPRVKYSLFKTQFVHVYPADHFTETEWMRVTNEFTRAITDSVIEDAFHHLPASAFQLRGEKMIRQMKERRDNIPSAMKTFYHFINKRIDIRTTEKNEYFHITGTSSGDMQIAIRKINKDGELKDTMLSRLYDHNITKEIRIYLEDGKDSVLINNSTSGIKLRIIGGHGQKSYRVEESRKKIKLYDREGKSQFLGKDGRLCKRLSNDSMNTAFVPVNLYHVTMPLLAFGYNLDDGFIFGAGFKHTHQGFRKLPYASVHQLTAAHSFSTKAYRIKYASEWIQAAGKGDILLQALIKAPDNTQNFFGRGNTSVFNKTGDFVRFYRSRFAIYQADAAIRWRGDKGSALTIGPSFQFYHFNNEDNAGRFISQGSNIGSYDSSTLESDRAHLGATLRFTNDTRDNLLFPSFGSFLSVTIAGYGGMNDASKSFVTINPEVSLYKSLNARRTIILANRLGGGVSFGKTAFYQSQFIGGHENLLGYRQYRFAGQHSFFNNTEIRIKIADFASYLLPGQIGFTGFFDVGRVWEKNDQSDKWHNGFGGGLYFSPAKMAVVQLVMGHSKEGFLPYFTMGFRF